MSSRYPRLSSHSTYSLPRNTRLYKSCKRSRSPLNSLLRISPISQLLTLVIFRMTESLRESQESLLLPSPPSTSRWFKTVRLGQNTFFSLSPASTCQSPGIPCSSVTLPPPWHELPLSLPLHPPELHPLSAEELPSVKPLFLPPTTQEILQQGNILPDELEKNPHLPPFTILRPSNSKPSQPHQRGNL